MRRPPAFVQFAAFVRIRDFSVLIFERKEMLYAGGLSHHEREPPARLRARRGAVRRYLIEMACQTGSRSLLPAGRQCGNRTDTQTNTGCPLRFFFHFHQTHDQRLNRDG